MKQSFLFFFLFLITVIPFHANADLLNSAVRIKAQIPEKARTSKFLGKEREGSGIVIDDKGHVLTIGYLVLEAGSVEITDVDGRVIAAAVEGLVFTRATEHCTVLLQQTQGSQGTQCS